MVSGLLAAFRPRALYPLFRKIPLRAMPGLPRPMKMTIMSADTNA
jgi:hypothetical protein